MTSGDPGQHLDIEAIERVLHDELEPGVASSVRDHIVSCPDCARRLAEAREQERRLFGLLSELDHTPPAIEPGAILARAQRPRSRPWAIAASLALLVTAVGIVSAIPGSHLRRWIDRVRITEPNAGAPNITTEGAFDALSGITVEPSYPFEIVFSHAQEAGQIRLRLVPGPDLTMRVEGAPVALESRPDQLAMSNAGSRSSYDILVPEGAPLVRLRIGSSVVLVKDGASVRTGAPRDVGGAYLIDMEGRGP